jgi:tRNA (mo5U34)-methyltransferase
MSDSPLRESIRESAARQRADLESFGWWHSIDLGDGRVTPGAHTHAELQDNYLRFGLPEDLTGKSVLDIGCWDGFYSFEAERHGADVVAVDCWRPETFFVARDALGSRTQFQELSVYDVTRDRVGSFDIVLFLGVLYHLRHPLLALERVCEVTREMAVIETHAVDQLLGGNQAVMEFYENDELGGQYDNWWGPTTECLIRMSRAAGFARVEVLRQETTRVVIKAFRQWAEASSEDRPSLRIHAVTSAINFDDRLYEIPCRGRHAFVAIWIEGLPDEASRETIRVEIGGYGINPIYAGRPAEPRFAGCAQINAPAPPGLRPGAATVRVSYGSQRSDDFAVNLIEGEQW